MIELYSLTSAARIFMTMLCFLAMLMQTLITIFTAQRRTGNHIRLLYETSLIIYFFTSAFICGLVRVSIGTGLYAPDIDFLRYVALLPALLAAMLFIRKSGVRFCVAVPMLLITLPVFDGLLGNIYPIAFIAVNFIFFISSLEKLILSWNAMRSGLSAISVKEALDLIPDGLLFANAKGHIILKNNSIDRILKLCHINSFLTLPKMYSEIKAIGTTDYCECISTGDSLLLRILNNGTYLITLTALKLNGREYQQLFAADITEEDLITKELDEYAAQLECTQQAIIKALNSIEGVERLKELLRLKQSIHDIIGQRLSIVHRFLEDMDSGRLSVDKLKELFRSLQDELDSAFAAAPLETFDGIQRLFSIIGVSVTLSGMLPEDAFAKGIILQIIREASTNAVRHGNAKNVDVKALGDGSSFRMTIINDGSLPKKNVVEGNGMKGMRENLSRINGTLLYKSDNQFFLEILIDKK